MKKLLSVLMALVLIMSVVGCTAQQEETSDNVQQQTPTEESQEEASEEQIIAKISGLKGPTSIGMIKMFEEKPSLGENIASTYQVAESPDILVARLLSKEVDFAALPTNVAAKLYNKGAGYNLAAVNIWGVLYVMTQEDNIKDWKDLKGKTINAVAKGSTPDVVFRYLLEKNGLDPEKDVTLDYTLGHVELAQSMSAGKINMGVLPEPFVTNVGMKNEKAQIALNLQDEWKKALGTETSYPQTCIVVREEFAQAHPEAVARFLEELKKSIDWVNANAVEAGVLVEKHEIGMTAKMAEAAIPRCNLRFEDAQKAKEVVDEYLNVLFDYSPKDVGGKLPDENFYYYQK
ncbi:ABC transporter substrate-binding protein [Clostridiaceae bacterium 35-E11]